MGSRETSAQPSTQPGQAQQSNPQAQLESNQQNQSDKPSPRHHHQFEIKLQIIREQFDELPAEGITSEDIQAWLLEQSDERGWTPATRSRYRDAFCLVIRKGVENHVLTVNPATLGQGQIRAQ